MDTTKQQRLSQVAPSSCQHVAAFLISCAVLISRRPDAVFHAQFLQEDGHTWFADVYNFGWWAGVCRTYEGYHHLFPRLGAALALFMPLAYAPLLLNLIEIALQAIPVNLLLSTRSMAWGSLRLRALLAGVYLALPNTREMLDNISQAQSPLTLCAFLLLVASPPKSIAGRLFDISMLLLCGLTGPQGLFLLPIALFLAWRHDNRWLYVCAGVLAVTVGIQGWALLSGGFSGRPHLALGAQPVLLARILAGHVFIATILGGNGLAARSAAQVQFILTCLAIFGTIFTGLCFAKGPMPLKLFLLLTSVLFSISLISPTAYPPPGVTMWQLLSEASGIRYWYLPSLAFAWSLLCSFQCRSAFLRPLSGLLLVLMCFGIIRDWRIPAMRDLHFAGDVRRFEAMPSGTEFTFPENPEGWNFQLVKHQTN